jgi:DNA-binding NarL/FixJ family response regulator
MKVLSHVTKETASLNHVQDYSYMFSVDNAQLASSDLIELHVDSIKRQMVQSKHDRATWEAAAIALCKTLDFMLMHARKLTEHEIAHRRKPVVSGAAMLTQKQLSAVYLASRGFKNERIAQELGISVPAVSQILSRSYRALGVSTRYEAIVKCREYSWI